MSLVNGAPSVSAAAMIGWGCTIWWPWNPAFKMACWIQQAYPPHPAMAAALTLGAPFIACIARSYSVNMFHVEHYARTDVPRGTLLRTDVPSWNITQELMFHVEHYAGTDVPRGTLNKNRCSTWNITQEPMFHVEHYARTDVPRGTLHKNRCSTWNIT